MGTRLAACSVLNAGRLYPIPDRIQGRSTAWHYDDGISLLAVVQYNLRGILGSPHSSYPFSSIACYSRSMVIALLYIGLGLPCSPSNFPVPNFFFDDCPSLDHTNSPLAAPFASLAELFR